jgi:hypothetical protein
MAGSPPDWIRAEEQCYVLFKRLFCLGEWPLLWHERAGYSLMVRTTLEVGRPSLAGPFTCFKIASS